MSWRDFTLVEWAIGAAFVLLLIAAAIGASGSGTTMDACRRQCGPGTYAALVPSGQYGLTVCACYEAMPPMLPGREHR